VAGNNTLAFALRMSLVALPAGLGLMALFPAPRVSAMHVLFISGFAVAVATRVVLGHSGKIALVRKRRGWLATALFLIVMGMVSRFVAVSCRPATRIFSGGRSFGSPGRPPGP
jgi:cytochrome c biogenesis protein CcdA